MRARYWMLLGLAFVIAFVGWGYFRSHSPRVRDLYGGAEAIDTIKEAVTIHAYRLPSPSMHTPLLADYTMSEGPIEMPALTAARLRLALMSDSAYLWGVAKSCGDPDYGVRFQFQHEGDSVDVLICFKCLMLGIYHNGKALEYEDFDPIRAELVAIAKELFPDDPAIQSLK